jgi:hypothetical protein
MALPSSAKSAETPGITRKFEPRRGNDIPDVSSYPRREGQTHPTGRWRAPLTYVPRAWISSLASFAKFVQVHTDES